MSFTATPVFIFFTIGTEILGNRTAAHATIQKKCQKSAVKQRHSLFGLVTVFIVFLRNKFSELIIFIKSISIKSEITLYNNGKRISQVFSYTLEVIMTLQYHSKYLFTFCNETERRYVFCAKKRP